MLISYAALRIFYDWLVRSNGAFNTN